MFVVQSTKHFGNALYPFVINLANARKPEETLTPLRDACISHDGSLMEMYTYISKLRQSFPLWVNHRAWFLSFNICLFHIVLLINIFIYSYGHKGGCTSKLMSLLQKWWLFWQGDTTSRNHRDHELRRINDGCKFSLQTKLYILHKDSTVKSLKLGDLLKGATCDFRLSLRYWMVQLYFSLVQFESLLRNWRNIVVLRMFLHIYDPLNPNLKLSPPTLPCSVPPIPLPLPSPAGEVTCDIWPCPFTQSPPPKGGSSPWGSYSPFTLALNRGRRIYLSICIYDLL